MKLDVSTRRGYDIATALRGPDRPGDGAEAFKQLVTAPLRHLVGVDSEFCIVRNPDSARVSTVVSEAAAFSMADAHVRRHARRAYEHLRSMAARRHFDWLKRKGIL